jgi:hypothetical protein
MLSTANYVVSRDTPTSCAYHATRSDGTEIAVNQDFADPVIQAALNQNFLLDPQSGHGPGDIYIQSGTYSLSPGFTGFQVFSFTRLTLDPTPRLLVPSGYAGAVFQLLSDDSIEVAHTMIDGGMLTEDAPPQHQWTGFLLKASATGHKAGIFFNKIANTIIFNAQVGIKLLVDSNNGFINDNTFQFLRMVEQVIFVDFTIDPSTNYQVGEEDFGILFNHFFDLRCQAGTTTTHGIKDIAGVHNTFLETQVIDIGQPGGVPDAKRATISSLASNTLIIGGILAGGADVFVDQGVATKILDS